MSGPRDSRVCPHHHLDVSVVDGDAADVGGGLPVGDAFLIQLTASQDEAWQDSGSTLPPSPQLDPTPVQEAHPRFPGRSPPRSDPRAPRSRALPQASRWEQGLHRAGLPCLSFNTFQSGCCKSGAAVRCPGPSRGHTFRDPPAWRQRPRPSEGLQSSPQGLSCSPSQPRAPGTASSLGPLPSSTHRGVGRPRSAGDAEGAFWHQALTALSTGKPRTQNAVPGNRQAGGHGVCPPL